jgi:plasmid maintenance system antidote protein VapI
MAARRTRYVATNLHALMRLQGRSLSWLGERMGYSRSHACHLAARRRRVTDEAAHICSESLGVPVWLLFEEADEVRGAR